VHAAKPRSRDAGSRFHFRAREIAFRRNWHAAEHILVEAGETLPVACDEIGVNVTRAADHALKLARAKRPIGNSQSPMVPGPFGSWELVVGSWLLGVGSWMLGVDAVSVTPIAVGIPPTTCFRFACSGWLRLSSGHRARPRHPCIGTGPRSASPSPVRPGTG
jgi:hypothetical protein